MCTSSYEGFALPGLEALACGTPVVATDVGAVRSYAGAAGTIVSSDDADELAPAMMRAVQAVNADGRLRALARARAESYSWDRAAVAMRAAVESLCGGVVPA